MGTKLNSININKYTTYTYMHMVPSDALLDTFRHALVTSRPNGMAGRANLAAAMPHYEVNL